MLNLCVRCHSPIMEGQRIRVLVESSYHCLKSTIAYALDKHDMTADADTLEHVTCPKETI